MAEKEVKPDLASLVAEIAREECRKMYEKRLTGLEEELAERRKMITAVQEYVHEFPLREVGSSTNVGLS
jgi:ElaB/YqjD/DUF883 family membrane-anchored ribosome-binding protein